MARLSGVNPPSTLPDQTSINLTRIIARLQQILVTPDADTERRLRSSSAERTKVGTNLEYARSLLLKLQQDAQNIKVQSRKQETQVELIRKREALQRLNERLQELNELGEYEASRGGDSSEGEDLLGEDTPSEETDSHTSPTETTSRAEDPIEASTPISPTFEPPTLQPESQTEPQTQPPPQPAIQSSEPQSTLRARHQAARTALLGPSATSTSTSLSTSTAESLLTHNRTEQESLTTSLLQMATALKQSSSAFASSLEDEKTILDSASSGMDKNELGLEAAQRKMGLLRSMSEGRGWWGRMLMYAWIAGLMVVAVVVVFVLPKLRF